MKKKFLATLGVMLISIFKICAVSANACSATFGEEELPKGLE